MANWKISLLTCFFVMTLAATGASALGVGEPAPPLKDLQWLKGEPVDLTNNPDGKVHVIEFWATWCGPCKVSIPMLTDIQKEFAGKLTIVSVTSPDMYGNNLEGVKRFIADQGSNMDYTIAFDAKKLVDTAYMSGKPGIPHAFVIDKSNKVAWDGSPLDATFRSVIRRVIDGTWDAERYKKVIEKLQSLDRLFMVGDWKGVRNGLIEVLELDPTSEVALLNLIRIQENYTDQLEPLDDWVNSFLNKNKDNAEAMHLLARALVGIGSLNNRMPGSSVMAAKRAYQLTLENPRSEIAQLYAMSLYQVGAMELAKEVQTQALKYAAEDEKELVKSVLDYYNECVEVSARIRQEQNKVLPVGNP